MSGVLSNLKCIPIQIGGVEDHVHLLFALSSTYDHSSIVRILKANSSTWIKREYPRLQEFQWQSGYGNFSVSHIELQRTVEYIRTQEQHHRRITFKDELRGILTERGLSFDEERLWD
jgi:REP element-mobilizing transposase RayT